MEVFRHFSGFTVPLKSEGYVHKPELAFFRRFTDEQQQRGIPAKRLFYIDDKQINLDGASVLGLHGILYRGAHTVRAALEQHGVLHPGEI